MNEKIFKAYDIRGVYGEDFDENTAYKIGLAYSQIRKEELPGNKKIDIVVGADMRISSPILKEKLIEGLLDGGCDVTDIGLSSTPTFYFAVASYEKDGGILVSASHNPKQYNGFKIVRNKAIPFGEGTGMEELRELVVKNQLRKAGNRGNLEKKEGVIEDQIKHDISYADLSKIKKMKIVIDTANAMGAQYFDELLKHLECEVIKMNWELDGTFPSHEADPFKEENVMDLGEKVRETGADLGIATDGDGDRIFFLDEKGEALDPGITRAILCKIFLKDNPGAKIAYDIRPGKITRDTIEENGGIPIVTRVGHSLIKRVAIDEGAVFAGESSGHFFLNMGDDGCYEVPVIVTLKILQELSESGKTFSEYSKPYEKYFHSREINSEVEDQEAKIEEIKKAYSDGEQNDLDGITIDYPKFWFNVRKSNTEPLLRLNLEASTKQIMEEKRDEILNLIRS